MSQNRKISYTKKVIRKSLFELMEKKSLKDISVKDICELADINRGSFYNHYVDKVALIEEITLEMTNQYLALSEPIFEKESFDLNVITVFLLSLQENKEMRFFIDDEINDIGEKIVRKKIHDRCVDGWYKKRGFSGDQADYIFSFLYGGFFEVIQLWYRNDFKPDAKKIAPTIHKLCSAGENLLNQDIFSAEPK